MRGRKRKPSSLSRIDGNPGGKRILEEPKPENPGNLEPPAWLDQVAAEEWRVVAPQLAHLDLLSIVDHSSLAAYCRAYSQWRAAEEEFDRAKKNRMKRKNYGAYRDLLIDTVRLAERMRHFVSEFGFSPVSRMRLAQDPNLKPDDFDKFMTSKGQLKTGQGNAPSVTLH